MNCLHPTPEQTFGLRQLWQEAFGDSDAFLDHFWRTGFSPSRCLCIGEGNAVYAALYWFDCSLEQRKIAYLYAVATGKSHRGQGLCRQLMDATLAHLQKTGYSGAILCPENEGLFAMYRKMGFSQQLSVREFTALPGETPVTLRTVDAAEFARLRRKVLPVDGVLQEGESLPFLAGFVQFYAGDGFLLTGSLEEGKLSAMEFLGDCTLAPGLLTALGAKSGDFRTPGEGTPFALYAPLDHHAAPGYLGLDFL